MARRRGDRFRGSKRDARSMKDVRDDEVEEQFFRGNVMKQPGQGFIPDWQKAVIVAEVVDAVDPRITAIENEVLTKPDTAIVMARTARTYAMLAAWIAVLAWLMIGSLLFRLILVH